MFLASGFLLHVDKQFQIPRDPEILFLGNCLGLNLYGHRQSEIQKSLHCCPDHHHQQEKLCVPMGATDEFWVLNPTE